MARRNRFYGETTPVVETEESLTEDILEIPAADDVASEIIEEVKPVEVPEIIPEIVVPVRPKIKEKICKVLGYNSHKQRVDFSFDGFGFNLTGVTENPGETITIKYEGKVGKPGFKFFL